MINKNHKEAHSLHSDCRDRMKELKGKILAISNIVNENPESEQSSDEEIKSLEEVEAIKIVPIEVDKTSDPPSPPRKTEEELEMERGLKKKMALAVQ